MLFLDCLVSVVPFYLFSYQLCNEEWFVHVKFINDNNNNNNNNNNLKFYIVLFPTLIKSALQVIIND